MSVGGTKRRCILLDGFSNTCAMTGWRMCLRRNARRLDWINWVNSIGFEQSTNRAYDSSWIPGFLITATFIDH
jgi:hypothetical protein